LIDCNVQAHLFVDLSHGSLLRCLARFDLAGDVVPPKRSLVPSATSHQDVPVADDDGRRDDRTAIGSAGLGLFGWLSIQALLHVAHLPLKVGDHGLQARHALGVEIADAE
jgi:hypothetical protein